LPVRDTLRQFKHLLTDYEKTELLDYREVYYVGHKALENKVHGKTSSRNYNYGYDDKNGDYLVVLHDHLGFRFEVVDFLGKGSFGQALKCLDHKTGEIVAVKIIKNKKRYQH
jgi:dual specificity tyrosine-phosphorylation-regulated kinase 2/3/4